MHACLEIDGNRRPAGGPSHVSLDDQRLDQPEVRAWVQGEVNTHRMPLSSDTAIKSSAEGASNQAHGGIESSAGGQAGGERNRGMKHPRTILPGYRFRTDLAKSQTAATTAAFRPCRGRTTKHLLQALSRIGWRKPATMLHRKQHHTAAQGVLESLTQSWRIFKTPRDHQIVAHDHDMIWP